MSQLPLFPPTANTPLDRPDMADQAFLAHIPHAERVKNKHTDPVFDVYIGRGSRWGNPFVIGPDGDRNQVIQKYRRYLWDSLRQGAVTIDDLLALEGKTLGCFCSPKPCHGHILLLAIQWARQQRPG